MRDACSPVSVGVEERSRSRASSPVGLVVPLAMLGGAGLYSAFRLVASPLVYGSSAPPADELAVIVGALSGGALGAFLGRATSRAGRFAARAGSAAVAALASSGASLAFGAIATGGAPGPLASALIALASAPPLLALGAWAMRLRDRSSRARVGSLVRESDARGVLAAGAVAASVVTVLALPSWLSAHDPGLSRGEADPLGALAIVVAAIGGVVVALGLDVAALVRVRGVATLRDRGALRGLRDDEVLEMSGPAGATELFDLGLGEAKIAVVTSTRDPYRSRLKVRALVMGDVARATSVLGWACARGVAFAAVCAGVLALHVGVRESEALRLAYHHHRCVGGGAPIACEVAASAVDASDPDRARQYRRYACAAGVHASCAALSMLELGR